MSDSVVTGLVCVLSLAQGSSPQAWVHSCVVASPSGSPSFKVILMGSWPPGWSAVSGASDRRV